MIYLSYHPAAALHDLGDIHLRNLSQSVKIPLVSLHEASARCLV